MRIKHIAALALFVSLLSIVLLAATMLVPNWVKATFKGPDDFQCQVGHLGAFKASFTPECAGGTYAELPTFTSDTIEFWPLFPLQATSNGNALPGVAGTTFESCEKSVASLSSAVSNAVTPAVGLAVAPNMLIRELGVQAPLVVEGIVEAIEDKLAFLDVLSATYDGIAGAYLGDALQEYFVNGGAGLAPYFENAASAGGVPVQAVTGAFAAISEVCGCALSDADATICPASTANAVGGIAAGSQNALTCAGSVTAVGSMWQLYKELSGTASDFASGNAPNPTAVGQFVGGSFTLFSDIRNGEATDENRFEVLYKDVAQMFIKQATVQSFILETLKANETTASFTPAILFQTLEFVKYCACHSPDPSNVDAMNVTCATPTAVYQGAGVAGAFLNAHGLGSDQTCSVILEKVTPALIFAPTSTGSTLRKIADVTVPTDYAPLLAQLRDYSALFSELSLNNLFTREAEFKFFTGETFQTLSKRTSAEIQGALGLAARCSCPATGAAEFTTPYCADAATYGFIRNLTTGNFDTIDDPFQCYTQFLPKSLTRVALSQGFQNTALAITPEVALTRCEDDNEDIRRIKLGRTMLIVAMPIIVIATIFGAVVLKYAVSDEDLSFLSKFAGLAGVLALVAAGITMFGLLTVQGAPVYDLVGVPCDSGVCYESDFASKIALAAVLVQIATGVSFISISLFACTRTRRVKEADKVDLVDAEPRAEALV